MNSEITSQITKEIVITIIQKYNMTIDQVKNTYKDIYSVVDACAKDSPKDTESVYEQRGMKSL